MSVLATLTPSGTQLLAKIVAAYGSLSITRVAIGDGTPAAAAPEALVHYLKDIPVSGVTYAGSNATILAQIISGETQLAISEIGVYARDPDAGEILLAYMGLDTPEVVRPNADGIYHAKEFSIVLVVGQVSDVLANIGSSTFVTQAQLAAGLAEKADKSKTISATLTLAAWAAQTDSSLLSARMITYAGPYTQTISVAGMTNGTNVLVDYEHSSNADTEAERLEAWGCISFFTNTDGGFIATCLSDMPSIDLPINAIVLG